MNEIKAKILEIMWVNENHADYMQIIERLGLKPRALNMHLRGLLKEGHVEKVKWHEYILTSKGREALGFPKMDGQLAQKVLGKTSPEKAFHFYRGIGQPTGVMSNSLTDFCEKLKTSDTTIIEFHIRRGDFETWVASLGDTELAKRLKTIRETKLVGESLRKKVYEASKSRCNELLDVK